ncbi:hypothetical protein B0J11DRAFT_591154, partial [Dendryphion nanum]
MALPSLLVFGSQVDIPDPAYLDKIRTMLLQDHRTATFVESIMMLPSLWASLEEFIPSFRHMPGRSLLDMLRCWMETGRTPDFTNATPNILMTPLTVIIHVVEYLVYLREVIKRGHSNVLEATKPNDFYGLCIGLLSSSIMFSAENEIEIMAQASIAIRLAVLIGAAVDGDGCYATPKSQMTSMVARCGEGTDRATLERILKHYPHAYISIVMDELTFTVTVLQSDVCEIESNLADRNIITKPIGVYGRFHHPVHTDNVERLLEFCEKDERFQPKPGKELNIRHIFEEILCRPLNWHATLSPVLDKVERDTGHILSIGPVNVVTEATIKGYGLRVVSTHDHFVQKCRAEATPTYPEHAIAVIGMGCRFPGAPTLEDFWELLHSGRTMASNVPEQRFSNKHLNRGKLESGKSYWGNFLEDADSFDHKFFRKSPREAAAMDPQQRVLLEVTYQALESAGWFGYPRFHHPEEDVGCFIGCGSSDYNDNIANNDPGAFSILGSLRGLLSGRISHYFGWEAPSITYDTACASSMVAIHAACKALELGECSAAVAGGVNMLTSPYYFQNLDAAGFLNRDGASRAFDAEASGYCRGEGAGVVVLKRLQDAIAHGDTIHGVINATSINQNYSGAPINVPSKASQVKLFDKVLSLARLSGSQITFVEAHGTGTQVGDCIEAESIREVFGAPDRKEWLYLGSVKDNIGHTEGAAGIASLIKVLLMMRYSTIAPQAGFRTLNPKIPSLEKSHVQILTKPEKWKAGFKIACVNNYGAGGCNAALIVCQPPSSVLEPHDGLERYPILISAKTDASLTAYCTTLLKWLDMHASSYDNKRLLAHLAFNLCKKQNQNFASIIAYDVAYLEELQQKLRIHVGSSLTLQPISTIPATELRPLILVFGGQSGRSVALSRALISKNKLLRTHLTDCDVSLKKLGYGSIFPAVYSSDYLDLATSHSVLFSIQYACAKSWLECGLKIDAVLGHSFGHFTALCISGVISLDDALKMVVGRAILIDSSWGSEKGAMVALETNSDTLSWLITTLKSQPPYDTIEVACYNGPSNYVLAGTRASIDALEELVDTQPPRHQTKLKRLNVPYAFHSCLTEPILSSYKSLVSEVNFRPSTITLATCTEGNVFSFQEDSNTTVQQTRAPVHFSHAIQQLNSRFGPCAWLEAGTGSPIIGMVRRALQASNSIGHSFQPIDLGVESNDQRSLTSATVALWKRNHKHNFWHFHDSQHNEYEDLNLPPYAFETTPHWLPFNVNPSLKGPVTSVPEQHLYCSFEGFDVTDVNAAIFKIDPRASSFKTLVQGHAVLGIPLCPASAYFDIAVQASRVLAAQGSTMDTSNMTVEISNLEIHTPLGYNTSRGIRIRLTRRDLGSLEWAFELISSHEEDAAICHASGKVLFLPEEVRGSLFPTFARLLDIEACSRLFADPKSHSMAGSVIYALFERVVAYEPLYHGVRRIASLDHEVVAQVALPSYGLDGHDHDILWPLAMDNFLQVAGLHVNYLRAQVQDEVYIACQIERLVFTTEFRCAENTSWTVYSVSSAVDDNRVVNDIFVIDSSTKKLIVVFLGVHFSRVPTKSLRKVLGRANGMETAQPEKVEVPNNQPRPTLPIIPELRAENPRPQIHAKEDVRNSSNADEMLEMNALSKLIGDLLGVSTGDVQPHISFEDLGIDSLMTTELATVIHQSFGIKISTAELQSLGNIRSLYLRLFGPAKPRRDKKNPTHSPSSPAISIETNTETSSWGIFTASSTDVSSTESTNLLPLVHKMLPRFDEYSISNQFEGYWKNVYPIHVRLVTAYIVEAFAVLGCPLATLPPGTELPTPNHHPRHKVLLRRLLEVLEGLSITHKSGNGNYVRTTKPVEATSSATLHELIVREFPVFAREHHLLKITGNQFAGCLSGKVDGIDLLFGTKANRDLLEDVYSNSPIFKTASRMLSDVLVETFSSVPQGEVINILEIGAGTGGTTRHLVNALLRAGINFTYTFTDVSSSLVTKAKQKFKEVPSMRFQVLDIESSVPENLHAKFHTVVSTNCIHATSNLVDSCRNIRTLLRPDGFLGLIELTRRMVWYDLVFGLLEGWWAFSDDRTHALIDERGWNKKLQLAGFTSVAWSSGGSEESKDIRIFCAFEESSPE